MSMQHAFKTNDRGPNISRPDALARYRLPPAIVMTTGSSATDRAPAVAAGRLLDGARRVFAWAAAAAAALRLWRERAYGRRNLAGLDPRMLRDIGISPSELWHETNKPFWRR